MDIFFSLDLLDKLHSNALEIVIQKAFQFISAHWVIRAIYYMTVFADIIYGKTQSGITIYANRDVSFSVEKGELAIILGSSGAGKSTVLNILGGMDTNDSGKVIIDGKDISKYTRNQLTAYRRTDVGFVFQFYNLVQNLTAKENVELASEIVDNALDPVTVLKDVGLADRINNFPAQLSGGEQQRVAIARAIAKNPKILLCDKPTGALDYNTGKQVLQILQDMSRQKGATVVIVTHNAAIAPIADRVIHMHDAKVSRIEENSNPKKIADCSLTRKMQKIDTQNTKNLLYVKKAS